ncbi:MAG: FG-GAP repeat protein, partial [Planctomycetes bacterium]|nr:FG-GAP repeat protein [Planctomycetota bacterium]
MNLAHTSLSVCSLSVALLGQSVVEGHFLKASNTGGDDRFGWAVAQSGDTIVVGAFLEDSDATGIDGVDNDLAEESGAAYVFVRSGSTWVQQAYLKASNTNVGDRFGHSVAISGDTIVVGAREEDSGATSVDGNQTSNGQPDAGAAYVFVRTGSTWTQQAYLKASN